MGWAEPEGSRAVTHLLWTGGWDSTYRLLELLCVHGREVQPHYILDEDRQSLRHELRTMAQIRGQVAQRPGLARLHPTRFVARCEVAPDEAITAAFHRLRQRGHLGSQYHWLARYAAQMAELPLELGFVNGSIGDFDIRPHIVERVIDGETCLVLGEPDDPDLRIFERFRFPLIRLDKPALRAEAQRQGFADLLEQSWFCHRPTSAGRPCGLCAPCRAAVELGMADRLPTSAHLRRRLYDLAAVPVRVLRRWR